MLVLTYLTEHNDGFGAQYQRILGIYSICKELNILYYHTPIFDIEYQGLDALMKNKNSNDFTNEINKRIHIKSDIENIDGFVKLKVQHINIESLLRLKENIDKNNKNVIMYLKLPYGITDVYSNMYLHAKDIYKTNIPRNSIFTIGVHVRRGELYVIDSNRMLPNEFYINHCKKIIKKLDEKRIPYKIELYTEVPDKKYNITGNHPGINNRIKDNIIIDPKDNCIHDFDCLPNLDKYINEDILQTFDRMINCDILIASKSSLSACASYIKEGITVYHPFWHNLISSDIKTTDHNLEKNINDFIELTENNIIPYECIQVWLQGDVKPHIKKNIIKRNRNINYIFFNNHTIVEYLKEHFDKTILNCYHKIKNPAHKCDLFRYCYLYKNGGIYIDVDLEFNISFKEMIQLSNYSDFITCLGAHSNKTFGECTNGILLCKKKNPIFLECIDKLLKNPNPSDYGQNVKDIYTILSPNIHKKYDRKHFSYYLFEEMRIKNKYYIVDKSIKIINTNGHNYL